MAHCQDDNDPQPEHIPRPNTRSRSKLLSSSSIKSEIPDDEMATGQEAERIINNPPKEQRRKMAAKSTQRKISMSQFFRQLLKSKLNRSKIPCNKCHKEFAIKRIVQNSKFSLLYQHARSHVDVAFFVCSICDRRFSFESSVASHLTKVHTISAEGNYRDSTKQHEQEIWKAAEQCFGKRSTECTTTHRDAQCEIAQNITDLYHSNGNKRKRMKCNVCGLIMTVIDRKGVFRVQEAIDHAMSHSEKFFYSCHQCLHRSVTFRAMRLHLRNQHVLGPHSGNFESQLPECKEDIIGMARRCFGKLKIEEEELGNETEENNEEEELQSKRTKRSLEVEARLRSRGGQNKGFIERQLHARRLTVKFSRGGFIRCRLCTTVLKTGKPSGEIENSNVISHSTRHLEQPLYKCKRCSDMIPFRGALRDHMKKKHGITKAARNECEDFTDDLHPDIMDALTRSFDWTGGKWSINEVKDGVIKKIDHYFGDEVEEIDDQDDKKPISVSINHHEDITPDELIARRLAYTRSLVSKYKRNDSIECRICSHTVKVESSDGFCTNHYAINHASTHVKKPLFKCKTCDKRIPAQSSMRLHLRREHGIAKNCGGHYEDLSNELHEDIMDALKRSFDWSAERKVQATVAEGVVIKQEIDMDDGEIQVDTATNNTDQCHDGLAAKRLLHARRLLRNFMKKDSIKCRICSHSINVKHSPTCISNRIALSHAETHVEKPLYKCKKCGQDLRALSTTYLHMRTKHGISKRYIDAYENRSNELHQDLLETLDKCFDWSVGKRAKKKPKNATVEEPAAAEVMDVEDGEAEQTEQQNSVSTKRKRIMNQDELSTERRIHCRRLLNKHAKDRSIKCRVCKRMVMVKHTNGYILHKVGIRHAAIHVEKPLYKCKKCGETLTSLQSVFNHMRKEHKVTKNYVNEYENMFNMFHQDLMEALTKSFDWTGQDW